MYDNGYVKISDVQNEIRKACREYSISYGEEYGGFAKKMATLTDNIPKAIVNVKVGYWISHTDSFAPYETCSVCGYNRAFVAGEKIQEARNYCPNCGAKMEAAE